MIQDAVWWLSIVLMGLLAAVFIWVAAEAQTGLAADYGPVMASAYRLRGWLFGLAIVILVAANYRTLGQLPYVSRAAAPPATIAAVDAVGEQWAWTVKPNAFAVGQTAEFHVTSKDVNHGFALYDPDLRIVAQTQAMPGYVNRLRYTFARPGVYRVLCLEYCGVLHHEMKSKINVTAR